ncbi:MAG: cell division protein FtsZ, partial [Cyanobacteria bacterium]|nr:cell division protein FtsZ [Cyanobacteria bacterium CG_2015-04_32_10]
PKPDTLVNPVNNPNTDNTSNSDPNNVTSGLDIPEFLQRRRFPRR